MTSSTKLLQKSAQGHHHRKAVITMGPTTVLLLLWASLAAAYNLPLAPHSIRPATARSPALCMRERKKAKKAVEIVPESPAAAFEVNVEEVAGKVYEMIEVEEVDPAENIKKALKPNLSNTASSALDTAIDGLGHGIRSVSEFNTKHQVVDKAKDAVAAAAEFSRENELPEKAAKAAESTVNFVRENEIGLKARAIFEIAFEGLVGAGNAAKEAAAKASAAKAAKKSAKAPPKTPPKKDESEAAPVMKGKKAGTKAKRSKPDSDSFGLF